MIRSHRAEEALPRFSLRRRITVFVLLATALVVGLVSVKIIPLELLPSGFSPPFLGVYIPWRDAPPQEVLEKIVKPMEDELSTVPRLESLNSFSSTGFGRCFMMFGSGTDMDVAYREVRDRIQRARIQLPNDADRIFIRKHDPAAIPVNVLGLAINPELTDAYDLIQNEIVLRLQRLDGVASVDLQGMEEKEVFIELDRERTEASGLNIYQLAMDLGADNFSMASGDIRYGSDKLLLRSMARYRSLDDIRNRLVAPAIRVKDVGTVTYKQPDAKFQLRANSRPAVAVVVFKEGQANTLEVARAVRKQVAALQENPRLQEIQIVPLFDQGQAITESLTTLTDSGRVGALFAALVLFFFLRRMRSTLIVTLSIPISILMAITVMNFAGESLNVLSLLGLMISVGLLVDNSVVVAENIHRLHGDGLSRKDAAIKGTGEVTLAVIMATLTTMIVFLPVALVGGVAQFFLLRLSLPISISLAASLGVACIFVPLTVYWTLRNDVNKPGRSKKGYSRFIGGIGVVYDKTLGRLNIAYGKLLSLFLRRRFDLVFGLLILLSVTFYMWGKKIDFVEVQEEERTGFEIQVELPSATSLPEAEEFFLECEKKVEGLADELGLSGWFIFHASTFGQVEGFFDNPRSVDVSPREALEQVMDSLPQKPGVKYFTGEETEQEEKGDQVHVVTLFGEDFEQLEETAQQIEERFLKVKGVLGLKSQGDPSPNELALVIDRERAQQQNINPQVIAGVVGYALRGQLLNRYHYQGRDVPIRVRFAESDRETLNQLKGFLVPAGAQGFVPLSSVTDVEYLATSRGISRTNKRTARTITLELVEGLEQEARQGIVDCQNGFNLPEGIRFGASAGQTSFAEDLLDLFLVLLLSVAFVYLLMGFLFESFFLPLSIICTIPLASIGVGWMHMILGFDMDFLGVVGTVLLVGVVVNNGIVLVDYVNRLRSRGLGREEALLKASHRRFRPIMMTALTTICGMIPVTLSGASSLGLSYTSFGLTLIGGLSTATLLTLLVVPVFYTVFDDLRMILGRVFQKDT